MAGRRYFLDSGKQASLAPSRHRRRARPPEALTHGSARPSWGPPTRRARLMFRPVLRRTIHFLMAEAGPTAVEYAVMLAFLIVVCVGANTTVGGKARGAFT